MKAPWFCFQKNNETIRVSRKSVADCTRKVFKKKRFHQIKYRLYFVYSWAAQFPKISLYYFFIHLYLTAFLHSVCLRPLCITVYLLHTIYLFWSWTIHLITKLKVHTKVTQRLLSLGGENTLDVLPVVCPLVSLWCPSLNTTYDLSSEALMPSMSLAP